MSRHTYETFWGATSPADNPADYQPVVLGVSFRFTVDCFLIGARFFRDLSDGGEHLVWLRNSTAGEIVRVGRFHRVPSSGGGPGDWQSAYFTPRLQLAAGDRVDVEVWFSGGNYYRTLDALAGGEISNPSGNIVMEGDDPATHPNGRYSYGADLFPLNVYRSSAYGVDPIIWVPYN